MTPDTQNVAMAGLLVGYEAERLPEPKTGGRRIQCDDVNLPESAFHQVSAMARPMPLRRKADRI